MNPCAGVAPAPASPSEPVASEAEASEAGGFFAILNNYARSGESQTGTSTGQSGDEGAGEEDAQSPEGCEEPAQVSQSPAIELILAFPVDPGVESCAVEGVTTAGQDGSFGVAKGTVATATEVPVLPEGDLVSEDVPSAASTGTTKVLAKGEPTEQEAVVPPASIGTTKVLAKGEPTEQEAVVRTQRDVDEADAVEVTSGVSRSMNRASRPGAEEVEVESSEGELEPAEVARETPRTAAPTAEDVPSRSGSPKAALHRGRHAPSEDRAEADTRRGKDGGAETDQNRAPGSVQGGGTPRPAGQTGERGQTPTATFGESAKVTGQTGAASGGNQGETANSAAVSRAAPPEEMGSSQGGTPTAPVARPHGAVDAADRWQMRVEDLGRVVTGMIWRGEKTLKVTLVPEQLGRITLSCKEQDGGLAVVMHAVNREAHDLLTRQEDAVRSLMAENGFKLTQFDVREGNDEGQRQRMDARGDPDEESTFHGQRAERERGDEAHGAPAVGAGGFWGIA